MRIVFIHGRSQQRKDPHNLKQEWIDALEKGLQSANQRLSFSGLSDQIAFPYYGDILFDLVNGERAHSEDEMHRTATFVDEVNREMNEMIAAPSPSAMPSYVARSDDQVRASDEDQIRGILNWKVTNLLLGGIDTASAKTAAGVISLTLKDVGYYLENHGARKRTDEIAIEALRRAKSENQPILVIAHSLGTIVAFSVLHALADDASWTRSAHLITLGSPLAIKAVKLRMSKEGWPPFTIPSSVASWLNGSDVRDIVALLPMLNRKTFFSEKVLPFDVTNLTDIDNATPNRHGIEGYLSDPSIARHVAGILQA